MTQDNRTIVIEVTPEQVADSLPVGLVENAQNGFQDVEIDIAAMSVEGQPDLKFSISFDGEGELIGTLISKPDSVTDEQVDEALTEFFASTEEEEDEEEDEEEEVTV